MNTEPPKTKTIEEGFHQNLVTGRYFARLKMDGSTKRTMRRLKGRTLELARREFYKLGKEVAPAATVAMVIDAYDKAECPGVGVKKRARTPEFLAAERLRCAMVKDFFGNMKAAEVNLGHCQQYHDWRIKKMKQLGKKKQRTGGRTVDMDMGTASNAFRFATLHTLQGASKPMMIANPWATGRPRYADPVHCREHCCRDGDELQTIAKALGGLVAIQLLFEACSGCRTGEVLPLRWDAPRGLPGYIMQAGGKRWLCIARLKQGNDDPYDYIEILPELELVLRCLKEYHAKLKKPSQWFFPGRLGSKHLGEGALIHALGTQRVTKLLPEGRKLTSHGARAFYCTWRRSQGILDAVIADEMGHRGGTRLLETTYGKRLPAYEKGVFSPVPATVQPFWGATSFDTRDVLIPALSQIAPVSTEPIPDNLIVLVQSNLGHTSTS